MDRLLDDRVELVRRAGHAALAAKAGGAGGGRQRFAPHPRPPGNTEAPLMEHADEPVAKIEATISNRPPARRVSQTTSSVNAVWNVSAETPGSGSANRKSRTHETAPRCRRLKVIRMVNRAGSTAIDRDQTGQSGRRRPQHCAAVAFQAQQGLQAPGGQPAEGRIEIAGAHRTGAAAAEAHGAGQGRGLAASGRHLRGRPQTLGQGAGKPGLQLGAVVEGLLGLPASASASRSNAVVCADPGAPLAIASSDRTAEAIASPRDCGPSNRK